LRNKVEIKKSGNCLKIGEANRERLPYKFVITRSMRQGELIIFTEEKWERFVEERLQVLRTAGSRAGNMLNIYFKAYAMEHEGNDDLLDLPEALIEQLVRNNVLDTKDQIVLEDNLEDSFENKYSDWRIVDTSNQMQI